MKRTLLIFVCVLSLLLGTAPGAAALEGETVRAADTLSVLGLVKGTAGGDYALNDYARRDTAAVLLVRLAGAEEAARQDPWSAGFRDVPAWCQDAVDLAVRRGWMQGQSQTAFGAEGPIDAQTWFTALLRMLGYPETVPEDAPVLAQRLGLVSLPYDGILTRGHLFLSMAEALSFSYRDSGETVLEHLLQTGAASRAAANAAGLLQPELSARQVADRHLAAVLSLTCYHSQAHADAGQPDASASAFFLTPDGLAVTNYHSIHGAVSATAELSTGERYPVESVLWYDPGMDLAVIRVSRTSLSHQTTPAFAALKTAPSGTRDLRAGDTVYALGCPLGLGLSVSAGVVSDPVRQADGYDLPCVMNTADISRGSSGGALLNAFGQVVAVTAGAYLHGNSMYLAVPIDPIRTADLSGQGQSLADVAAAMAEGRRHGGIGPGAPPL